MVEPLGPSVEPLGPMVEPLGAMVEPLGPLVEPLCHMVEPQGPMVGGADWNTPPIELFELFKAGQEETSFFRGGTS